MIYPTLEKKGKNFHHKSIVICTVIYYFVKEDLCLWIGWSFKTYWHFFITSLYSSYYRFYPLNLSLKALIILFFTILSVSLWIQNNDFSLYSNIFGYKIFSGKIKWNFPSFIISNLILIIVSKIHITTKYYRLIQISAELSFGIYLFSQPKVRIGADYGWIQTIITHR